MGKNTQKVDIPQTKEYGWTTDSKGELVYKATRKVVTNRIRFIVESVGGIVEMTTTGFKISQSDRLTQDHIDQMTAERSSLGIFESPEGISKSDEGIEQPNLD